MWFDICAGKRCRRCEVETAAPVRPELRYCSTCAPDGAAPHPVLVSIDHHREGWSVTFAAADTEFVYWLVCVTDERLHRIIDRATIAPSERAGIAQSLRAWGRTSFYVHMDQVQFRNLERAYREDPRNGYEKLRGLPRKA